jgi:Domain of unknown function (DUF4253)
MPTNAADDPFALLRAAGTNGANFDLDTDAIIERLTQWQALCSFSVTEAEHDSAVIEFETLLRDMEAFVRDLYDFCPDLVDQGTGCVAEMVEVMEATGGQIAPDLTALIEGVDFSDENYGLEILKREIEKSRAVKLWWD